MIADAASPKGIPRVFAPSDSTEAASYDSPILSFAIYVYLTLYLTEGLTRYLLLMVGADSAIFVRDLLLFGGVIHVLALQAISGRVDRFVLAFAALIVVHGMVGYLNLQSIIPVLVATKAFASIPAGALLASKLFADNRRLRVFLIVLLVVGFVSAGLEKYFVDWPWIGLKVELGGQQVEIGHDWQTGASDKRAGGLARSSIHLAAFMSLAGLLIYFGTRSLLPRLIVGAMTATTIFWTTQKGALLAAMAILPVGLLPERLRVPALKLLLTVFVVLMIALPLILPGYVMPRGASGIFSMASFYDRIERMWPDAWVWYSQKSIPLIGVGLGGIGVAMRFYSKDTAFYAPDISSYEPYLINAADNMFVYLFVQFGVLALFYIAFMVAAGYRQPSDAPTGAVQALAILVFIVGYGVAIGIVEDQVCALFLGASLHRLWFAGSKANGDPRPSIAEKYAVPFVPLGGRSRSGLA